MRSLLERAQIDEATPEKSKLRSLQNVADKADFALRDVEKALKDLGSVPAGLPEIKKAQAAIQKLKRAMSDRWKKL